AGGDSGARRDEHVPYGVGLVDGGATDQPDALGDAVHAVDVGLAELAAVGVDRQPAPHLQVAVGDEVAGLSPGAEAQLLQLRQHQRGEVVVQDGRVHVVRAQPALRVELPGDQAHLRDAGDLRPVV